jgi:mannose-1-phosphate guanylyltransferase
MSQLYAVIMAGGAGTRFWPASRPDRPKQLLPLAGRPDEPLIAATVRRILPLCSAEHILVVTAGHLTGAMRGALPALPAENFLSEPAPRNTAPCIAWATATVARRDPDAVVMVLPSDHFIADEAGFRTTALAAAELAKICAIATIGITPTRPETGYGYMEKGQQLGGSAFAVKRFVEKPDRARAETYVTSGQYLWNSGMFFFRARAMSEMIGKHLPELARGIARIDHATVAGNEAAELASVFPTLPAISIDHGVMEKADSVAMVAGDFGWSDVGSWQSTWELADKDPDGNAAPPSALLIEARGNLVSDLSSHPSARVVALVGVHDLAVVITDDALLIIPRERAQDVRKAIEALRDRKV